MNEFMIPVNFVQSFFNFKKCTKHSKICKMKAFFGYITLCKIKLVYDTNSNIWIQIAF